MLFPEFSKEKLWRLQAKDVEVAIQGVHFDEVDYLVLNGIQQLKDTRARRRPQTRKQYSKSTFLRDSSCTSLARVKGNINKIKQVAVLQNGVIHNNRIRVVGFFGA